MLVVGEWAWGWFELDWGCIGTVRDCMGLHGVVPGLRDCMGLPLWLLWASVLVGMVFYIAEKVGHGAGRRALTGLSRGSHKALVGLSWGSCGGLMGPPRGPHGALVGLSWGFHVAPMGLTWGFQEALIELPWS